MPNKSIEDGNNNSNKRVSSKPKWNRLDVDAKTSSSYASQQSSRRRSPPRGRRDDRGDYYREERSVRRVASNRSNVPPSNRGAPRGSNNPVAVTNNNGSIKSSSASSRQVSSNTSRRGGENTGTNAHSTQYITRSDRPSYTASKTPGLNGNPIMKPSDSALQAPYDAKKPKPLLGHPIIIEAATPIPIIGPNVWNGGATYYFNGVPPYTIDAIENIKESIKKQM